MSDGSTTQPPPEHRPPGWQAPAEPARTWPVAPVGHAPPPYGAPPVGYAAPMHPARPVYKPGTIPLRPLTLSDMFSGATETIRRNPKATLGVAAVVLTAFLALPTLATLAWGLVEGFGSELDPADELTGVRPEDIGLIISLIGGALLGWLATVVLTGMVVHVVEHAARGEKLTAGAAWRLTRPRIWRLVGLAVLSLVLPLLVWVPVVLLIVLTALASGVAAVLVGIVAVLGGILLMAFVYIRWFQLAAASMVLEERGVFSSMGRSWQLSRGAFWRIFGIALLTLLVTQIAAQFLSFPLGLLSVVGTLIWPGTMAEIMVQLLTQNVAQVVAGSLTTPFSASVAALLYLDQRIRKEGYDIELISGAHR